MSAHFVRPHRSTVRDTAVRIAGLVELVFVLMSLRVAPLRGQSGVPTPPVAPVRPVIDTLYGTTVADPYRYLEHLDDSKIEHWFRGQNAYARAVLDRIPGRSELLAELAAYDRTAPWQITHVTVRRNNLYFYEKRRGEEEVAKLYVRRGLRGTEHLLVDPNQYGKHGEQWSISYFAPSWDGRYVAVGVAPDGSEQSVIHVLDIASGRDTGEVISRADVARRIHWYPDDRSFFYRRLAPPSDTSIAERYQKSRVYLHVVGTPPERDEPVLGYGLSTFVTSQPGDAPAVITAPRSSYAVGVLRRGVRDQVSVYIVSLDSVRGPATPWQKLVETSDSVTQIALHQSHLYLLTNKDAPRFRVLELDLRRPELVHAKVSIPESDATILAIGAAGDGLYLREFDGHDGRLVRLSYGEGPPERVALPFEGNVGTIAAVADVDGPLIWMGSWTRRGKTFAVDPRTHKMTETGLEPTGPYDRSRDLVADEVNVQSYDGTMVPLSIVHRREISLNGTNPTMLTVYGAYGEPMFPWFDPGDLPWFDRGGVMAYAHVRGGGDLGEPWHRAGMKLTKPNTWRDLIACAEYLIRRQYTTHARLMIVGASAGGIAVGRALTERPDLFAAVEADAGDLNPLRGQDFSANGPPNAPEFGSIKTQAGFEDLYAMDAYQHVRDGVAYPAVLLTTGWNDPRVPSWEPGKMAARLQAASSSGKPVLLVVDFHAGHAAMTQSQLDARWADTMAFALWQFGVRGFRLRP